MKTIQQLPTYGGELEKPVADVKTGNMAIVSQRYFQRLAEQAKRRNTFIAVHKSDLKPTITLGTLSADLGEQGLDNGFNLVETSLPYTTSLTQLYEKMVLDLSTVQYALSKEDKTIVNLSIHPLGRRDYETYATTVAPKGIYPFLWYRGWDHTAGIDARAQNSPSTGVSVHDAADAVSVIIGCGAAFIGLFGNSPYEECKRSEFKESRCSMWSRMMRHAKVGGDRRTAHFPPERFRTMAQYFTWMFDGDSGIYFVLDAEANDHGYKGIGDRIMVVEGTPSVLEYLRKPNWNAYYLKDVLNRFPPKRTIQVKPSIAHMEILQFAQFAGARIRYGLKKDNFPLKEFLVACKKEAQYEVERVFRRFASYVYIEGRDPGAIFPDVELWDAGADIARSAVISPSAIQAGLLRNLKKTVEFIDSFPWKKLGVLRDTAIRDGLQGQADGTSVYTYAKKILELASEGLSRNEQWMLTYPLWVLQNKKNGADRAIEFVQRQKGSLRDRIAALVTNRHVILM